MVKEAIALADARLAEVVRRLVAALQPERIYLFGSRALEHNRVLSSHNPALHVPYRKQLLLPRIVTTARIYSCGFDPADVDPRTGEIPYDRVSIEEHPYIL